MPTEIHQQLKGLINIQTHGISVPLFVSNHDFFSEFNTNVSREYSWVRTARVSRVSAHEIRDNRAFWQN